jgi:L-lysine 2,3-aminomutase
MHVLDKVAGAAHFDLPRSTAQLLQTKLQELLPAYLVPRFVEEIPGRPSKTLVI